MPISIQDHWGGAGAQIANSSQAAMIIQGTELIEHNSAFRALLGPIQNKTSLEQLFTQADFQQFQKHCQAVLAGQCFIQNMEVSLLRSEAEPLPVCLQIMRAQSAVLVCVDANPNKEIVALREALTLSQQTLQEFSYMASHDLNTPLRQIQSLTELLARYEEKNLSERGLEFMQRIQMSTQNLQKMLQALLAYSRIETRRSEFEQVCLLSLMGQLTQGLQAQVTDRQAIIHSEEIPLVWADSKQIQQVLQALLENSLFYTPQERTPEIRLYLVSQEKNRVNVAFQDNGQGIAPRFAKELFKPFVRLQRSQNPEGVGMGLAIAQKILQRHGSLLYLNPEYTAGAEFHFSLPIKAD